MSDAAGRVTEPTMPQEIYSGGHLVAKALRNEGVDVIFTPCGGQIMKYGERRGNVGNMLGDVPFEAFAEMLGGYGEGIREPGEIHPALERAREAVKSGKSAVVNFWVDPDEYAPGTKAQTMYK